MVEAEAYQQPAYPLLEDTLPDHRAFTSTAMHFVQIRHADLSQVPSIVSYSKLLSVNSPSVFISKQTTGEPVRDFMTQMCLSPVLWEPTERMFL